MTLTLNGNSNEQVLIDGQSYTSGNNGYNNAIQITNLQPGQHTLQVVNNNGVGRGILGAIFGGRNNTTASTSFNLTSGYDTQIAINANGRARIRQTRSANYQNNSYRNNQNNRDRYNRNNDPNYNR